MPIGNESRANWPNAPLPPAEAPNSSRIEFAAVRCSPMPARRVSFDHVCSSEPRLVCDAEVGHHDHGVHELRRREVADQLLRPDLSQVRPVHRRQHQRLLRGPPLVHARQLHQGCGVGGAPGRLGHGRGVAGRDDHDLAPRAPGPAADHVHELMTRVREAPQIRPPAAAAAEPAGGERVRHELRRGQITARAGPTVGCIGGDAGRQIRRLSAVEEDVGGQPLGERPWPALEREHGEHHRQQRRHEGRSVHPRFNHSASTYNSEG